VLLAHKALKAHKVRREIKGRKALNPPFKALKVHRAHKAHKVIKGHKALLELRELAGLWGIGVLSGVLKIKLQHCQILHMQLHITIAIPIVTEYLLFQIAE